jgi:hypothetical protein
MEILPILLASFAEALTIELAGLMALVAAGTLLLVTSIAGFALAYCED